VDAIVAEELRKRYKTVQALNGVSFSVREGEVFDSQGNSGRAGVWLMLANEP
jgi:ABC-type multidrug transport system ATPase subunit